MQSTLKSEHYDFRVIRENTSNQAVLTDLALLNQLCEDEFNELFEVDEKQNVVRYVSPIRVEQECFVCHGATESLDQDPSGIFKNELHRWKVVEIQGAFSVIVDNQFISDRFEETILKTLLEDLIALCCVLVIAFLVTHSILKQLKSFFIRLHQVTWNNVRISEQVRQNGTSVALLNESQATQLIGVIEKIKKIGTHSLANLDRSQLNINATNQLNDSF